MNLHVLADKHLYNIREMLPPETKLTLYEPTDGLPDDATGYDALFIRTVTKINPETLPDPGKLSFIGTATAGVDHIDLNHLKKLGIHFAHSPGCNARAVGEYVLTGILQWARLRDQPLELIRVGIVGCGNTGSAVMELLSAFDIEYIAYDPPKQKRDPDFVSASEDELLSCNILTLHTPLTHTGPHPTFHLLSKSWLDHPFRLIINASRGGVLHEQALREAMHRGTVRDCILDVWENEPVFSDAMADMAMIATPHIAGYSKEAKTAASRMVAEQFCKHFDLKMPRFKGPEPQDQTLADIPENLSLSEFLWEINQIDLYDRKFRELMGKPDILKAKGFSHLRTSIPTRYEYASLISAHERLWREKVPKDAEKLIRS